MRLALISAASVALAACGPNEGETGPERRSAAGEVLGGEVSDDMLPLDTVRSTSPAGPSGPAEPDAEPSGSASLPAAPDLPRPQVSGGPEPYVPSGIEDTPVPSATPD